MIPTYLAMYLLTLYVCCGRVSQQGVILRRADRGQCGIYLTGQQVPVALPFKKGQDT